VAKNLPLFSPFVQPKAVIFPQHCDLLAISVGVYAPPKAFSVDMLPHVAAITLSDFGYPNTPSGFWGIENITLAMPNPTLSHFIVDQTDQNLTLSIGGAVTATGVQNFTGAMVGELLLWTTGPPCEELSSGAGPLYAQWTYGMILVNMSLLGKKYGVGLSSGKSHIVDITWGSVGYYEDISCWAEAIPHARTANFGTPNSLSRFFSDAQAYPPNLSAPAPALGWNTTRQQVAGWSHAEGLAITTGTGGLFNPIMSVNAYKSGSGYTVSITGSGWPGSGPELSETSGSGSD
jgi:hypothetical protein